MAIPSDNHLILSIEEDSVSDMTISCVCHHERLFFSKQFRLKLIFAEDLVEHNFDVVRGVPVAVVIE